MKYKNLGNTGVLVSELCLGTMTFGGKGFWEAIGQVPQAEVNELVKISIDEGINFIDTANVYSEGQSEELLGQSLIDLGIRRHQVFIATKVLGRTGPGVNEIGLSRLNIMYSVDESLKRLQTEHIDLLYLHGMDLLTPVEETMRALENVVRAGKVRYIGVSNHPAWHVIKANGTAEQMGWSKFVASQNYYTIAGRDIERELIPMLRHEGISLMPWSPLAGGFLTGKYTRRQEKAGNSRRDDFDFPPLNKQKAYDIIDVLIRIGKSHGTSAARIALAWMLNKPGVTSIIIGAKNKDQLIDNIASTELELSDEEMNELDRISELEPEYPGWMVDRQTKERKP